MNTTGLGSFVGTEGFRVDRVFGAWSASGLVFNFWDLWGFRLYAA